MGSHPQIQRQKRKKGRGMWYENRQPENDLRNETRTRKYSQASGFATAQDQQGTGFHYEIDRWAELKSFKKPFTWMKLISGDLEASFSEVEVSLLALEDTIDAVETQKKQTEERRKLDEYREKKNKEFQELSGEKNFVQMFVCLRIEFILQFPLSHGDQQK